MSLPCIVCREPATKGSRCARHQYVYRSDGRKWRNLSERLLAAHRRQRGNVCPGDETHAAHASRDLTVDHIVPLSEGGPAYDRANLRILCGPANSARRVTA